MTEKQIEELKKEIDKLQKRLAIAKEFKEITDSHPDIDSINSQLKSCGTTPFASFIDRDGTIEKVMVFMDGYHCAKFTLQALRFLCGEGVTFENDFSRYRNGYSAIAYPGRFDTPVPYFAKWQGFTLFVLGWEHG